LPPDVAQSDIFLRLRNLNQELAVDIDENHGRWRIYGFPFGLSVAESTVFLIAVRRPKTNSLNVKPVWVNRNEMLHRWTQHSRRYQLKIAVGLVAQVFFFELSPTKHSLRLNYEMYEIVTSS
jgi:hypothetical protein